MIDLNNLSIWSKAGIAIGAAVVTTGITIGYFALSQPMFECRMVLAIPSQKNQSGLSGLGIKDDSGPLLVLTGIANSNSVRESLRKEAKLTKKRFRESYSAVPVEEMNQIHVTWRGDDRVKSRGFLERAKSLITGESNEMSDKFSTVRIQQLEASVNRRSEQVNEASAALQSALGGNPLIVGGITDQSAFRARQDLSELTLRISDLRGQLSAIQGRARAATFESPDVLTLLDEGNPAFTDLARARSGLAQLQNKFSDSAPDVIRITNDIAALRKLVRQEREKRYTAIMDGTAREVADLVRQLQGLEARAQVSREIDRVSTANMPGITRLQTDLQVKTASLTEAIRLLETARYEARIGRDQLQVLDDPTCDEDPFNKPYVNGGVAAFLSTLAIAALLLSRGKKPL